MKKAWEKPKLVVLVRGKPEERILNVCKEWETSGDGPNTYATRCFESGLTDCTPCLSDSAS